MFRVLGKDALESLSDSPSVNIGGRSYLAVLLGWQSSPSNSLLLVLYPESSWREARWESAQAPLVLGAAALVLAAAATTWTARRISGRIHRLEHQVARIAQGDFRGLEAGRQDDEIQDLERLHQPDVLSASPDESRPSVRLSVQVSLRSSPRGWLTSLRNAVTGARLSLQLHGLRCGTAAADPSLNVALRQLTLIEEQVRGLLTLGRQEERPRQDRDMVRLLCEVAALIEPAAQHGRVELVVCRSDPPSPSPSMSRDCAGRFSTWA